MNGFVGVGMCHFLGIANMLQKFIGIMGINNNTTHSINVLCVRQFFNAFHVFNFNLPNNLMK